MYLLPLTVLLGLYKTLFSVSAYGLVGGGVSQENLSAICFSAALFTENLESFSIHAILMKFPGREHDLHCSLYPARIQIYPPGLLNFVRARN